MWGMHYRDVSNVFIKDDSILKTPNDCNLKIYLEIYEIIFCKKITGRYDR